MPNFIRHIASGALLGAVIGAVAFFFLAEGMVEGLFGGVIIGGSVGALLAGRIHAHRAAVDAAKVDPEEARRQARLRDARGKDVSRAHERHQLRGSPGLDYLDSKIRDD
ncbi:MAG: hypothetical protein OXG60_15440 [Chloroflexi bacterium]|nr:hypothetical protein [Chloroflexota bacterium]